MRMSEPKTIRVTVTEIPKRIFDRIAAEAIRNGIAEGNVAAQARWALVQYCIEVLDKKNDVDTKKALPVLRAAIDKAGEVGR
jgi:hypothetical protein